MRDVSRNPFPTPGPAPPETHESLISRKTGAEVPLTGLSLSHPSECVAAVGWFAIVTGIAAATRRPIDAILAHAATNLALGAYVLFSANWWLL